MAFTKNELLDMLKMYGVYGSGWWTRYPKRAVEEIYKMYQGTNTVLIHRGNKIIWEEEIFNNYGTRFVISIEAANYPHTMPDVYVKDSEIDISSSKHLYPPNKPCLMEPHEYNSNISILELRNLLCAWCWCAETYINTGEWPAAEAD